MTLITEPPADLKSTNALDDIDTSAWDPPPPAYLSFGQSSCALEDPPNVGEIRTYIVRARCTGEHGPIERKDGEMRYTRTLSIISAWEQGKPEPPNPSDEQPALFDHDGEPVDDGHVVDCEIVDDEEPDGEDPDDYGRPGFSDSGE